MEWLGVELRPATVVARLVGPAILRGFKEDDQYPMPVITAKKYEQSPC
jgi:hypothetical protein